MRSTAETSKASIGVMQWNSPVPYVFGGLTVMFGLIVVALLILACFHHKSTPAESSSDTGKKPTKNMNNQADMEPEIVVIMAGDDIPTYLAKPVSSTCHMCQASDTLFHS